MNDSDIDISKCYGETVIFSVLSMNTAILLQPIQLMINIMFIPIFITYFDAEVLKDPTSAWYGDSGHEFIQAIVILVLGVVNIFICFTDPRCKRQKTTSSKVGDQESCQRNFANVFTIFAAGSTGANIDKLCGQVSQF